MALNNIRLSYLARFLRDLQFFGAIIVPFFLDWLQVSYTQFFLLESWFVLWIVLLEIPTGIVADKYGRKISLALGVLFFGIDLLLLGLLRDYYLLYIAEFIGALGYTLISGADQALIYDYLIEQKKQKDAKHYLARYEAAGTLGLIISLPLGSIIADSASYPFSLALTFILSGACTILSVFFFLMMKEPKRRRPTENFVRMGIDGLKYLNNHKVLRAFAINSVFISSVTSFIFWFYQPMAGSAGIGLRYYGFIGAGFNLFAVLLLMNTKKLEKVFGMKNLLMYSAIVPAVLFIGAGLVNGLFLTLLAIFLIAGLKMLRTPILSDYMNRYIQGKNRATILSSISLVERATTAILYPVVGFFADISLSYVLIFLGILTLVFAIITRLEESHLVCHR
ncbi:MAG TPA: MFS transporter [Candidatus Nanoarchaeia archaeon]|nr:MFS transporter [Candidatus Nanoarchaeia archaeon]